MRGRTGELWIHRIEEKTKLESYYSYYQILIVEESQHKVNSVKHLEPTYVIENVPVSTGVMLCYSRNIHPTWLKF